MTALVLAILTGCNGEDAGKGPASITVGLSPVNYGVVEVGGQTLYHDMQLTNTGGDLLTIESIYLHGDHRCSFDFEGPDSVEIPGTQSTFLRLWYVPEEAGEDQVTVEIVSNADNFASFEVGLCGLAVDKGQGEGTEPTECTGALPSAESCPDNEVIY